MGGEMAKFETVDGVSTLTITEDEHHKMSDMSSELTVAHYQGGRPSERCDEQWAIFMRELLGKAIWNQVRDREDVRTVIEACTGG